MPSFAGSEGSVHYDVWQPTGPPQRRVLIVHGYAEYGARYRHVARVLVELGAAVYAPITSDTAEVMANGP